MEAKESALFNTEKHFWQIVVATVAIKMLLAYVFPLTSDEAYFYIWGLHPDINYYDHPPVTGWVTALFLLLGDHIFFVRLFAVVSGLIVAWGIHTLVKDGFGAPDKAKLICLAFLVSPLNMLFVLITTDTPVYLFVFLSGLAFFYSLRGRNRGLMVLSGIFWGLAILSKYFAVLLLIAFLVVLILRKERKIFLNLLLFLIGALPFIFFHIYGNYQTCWTNVLFNVYNRNRNVSWEFSGLLVFLAYQVYLGTPWLYYFLIKHTKEVARGIQGAGNLFTILFLVPMVIFGVIAFHDSGLHWTLSLYPFLFLMLIHVSRPEINRTVTLSMGFSIVHVVIILGVLTLPIQWIKDHQYYNDVVMAYHGPELYQKVRETYGSRYILATNGYYTSGAMTYYSGEYFIVFMDHSKHGRYDDKLTDFRQLDGKDILVLRTLPIDEDYSPYFEKVTYETLTLQEGTFYIVLGEKLKYKVYQELFLKEILNNWYRIPDFLPVGECYFYEKYCEE